MCGISGYFAFKQNALSDLTKITQTTEKLLLRGPDSGNSFVDKNIALGHRRLSIIDTSAHAMQPMQDSSGRYVLVFNGEIFNFKHLANRHLGNQWQALGKTTTNSDTEVLLYLLIHYGTECINWLSGFFAFAFYDRELNTLLVARDRYGKKPFMYYADDDKFAFASEMKALLEWGIPKELNFTVLQQYLQLNYIPQPQSIFKGVLWLKQGHYMHINGNGKATYKAYYTLKLHTDKYNQYTYEEAQKRLVNITDNAVQDRMISDVPLGAFLSGGIDSSLIVALASQHTAKLKTFSVGYKDNAFFDETSYAKLVADRYKTEHTVFSLSNNDFLEHIYQVLDYFDEPFADSSAIPEYILSYHTRKYVTVALSGDGGDEVFSGYNKHAAEFRIRQNNLINNFVKWGEPIWKIMPRSRNTKSGNFFRQLLRFAEGSKLNKQDRYWRWASFNTQQQASALLSGKALQQVDLNTVAQLKDEYLSYMQSNDFNEVLLCDMNLVLVSDMLVKVDRMSMANSLEIRSPLLDQQVVDFAFSLPANYKIDAKMKKRILQDAFRPMLPPEIYNRPKHGFEIPLLQWFRNELWGLINDDLLAYNFVKEQGIFDANQIEKLKTKLKSNNPEDSHATIWALIVFQYWWKKYFN
jgi:asparagine synthase (glutamine-hydrolysing)